MFSYYANMIIHVPVRSSLSYTIGFRLTSRPLYVLLQVYVASEV